nr:MAG TPA: hypothetical protein [Caudoviricetes sp.]
MGGVVVNGGAPCLLATPHLWRPLPCLSTPPPLV